MCTRSAGDGRRDVTAVRLRSSLVTRQPEDCYGREPLAPVRTLVSSLVYAPETRDDAADLLSPRRTVTTDRSSGAPKISGVRQVPPRPAAPSIEDILGRLTLLAPLAGGNRGPVPLDDPRRAAAAAYTWLLATAHENPVPTAALVQATNCGAPSKRGCGGTRFLDGRGRRASGLDLPLDA